MPKIDIAKAAVRTGTIYPGRLAKVVGGREKQILGDLAGLTQFGVNLARLKPGAGSAMRHWHEKEDEFVYVLAGEITLIENGGEILLRPGEAAGFKCGDENAHMLVNKGNTDALYLEVGTRSANDCFHYPDENLVGIKDPSGVRFQRPTGEPYSDE